MLESETVLPASKEWLWGPTASEAEEGREGMGQKTPSQGSWVT